MHVHVVFASTEFKLQIPFAILYFHSIFYDLADIRIRDRVFEHSALLNRHLPSFPRQQQTLGTAHMDER